MWGNLKIFKMVLLKADSSVAILNEVLFVFNQSDQFYKKKKQSFVHLLNRFYCD